MFAASEEQFEVLQTLLKAGDNSTLKDIATNQPMYFTDNVIVEFMTKSYSLQVAG